jgi:putative colanic acid biosynthesis glycosyltransferase
MLGRNAMSAPTPFISVIVVCKNPGARLKATLASIRNQHEFEPELIVVDGGSTDGSRAWLESQRSQIATLISEPDRGVYDAMNKGLSFARGEWVLFLGADDQLADAEVLCRARDLLNGTTTAVAVGESVYDDGRIYRFDVGTNPVARNFAHHQAAFYRRALFVEHGMFDGSLTVMADYDLNLRFQKKGAVFAALALRIATCGSGGLSDAGSWRGYAEEIRVRHRYFSPWRCWLWDAGTCIRFLRKKLIRSFTPHG